MKSTIPTQAQLKAWSTEKLWTRLQYAIGLSVDSLRLAAVIWVELQDRGEDMSQIRLRWTEHFPAIAAGRLDPQIIVAFGGVPPALLALMAGLPIEDQATILDPDYRVPVLVPNQDRTDYEVDQCRVLTLRISEARQVFGDGHIRPTDEQRQYAPPLVAKRVEATAARMATIMPSRAPSDGALPGDVALLDVLDLTGTQRRELVQYAATRRPPISVRDLVKRMLVQRNAMPAAPESNVARRMAKGDERHAAA